MRQARPLGWRIEWRSDRLSLGAALLFMLIALGSLLAYVITRERAWLGGVTGIYLSAVSIVFFWEGVRRRHCPNCGVRLLPVSRDWFIERGRLPRDNRISCPLCGHIRTDRICM